MTQIFSCKKIVLLLAKDSSPPLTVCTGTTLLPRAAFEWELKHNDVSFMLVSLVNSDSSALPPSSVDTHPLRTTHCVACYRISGCFSG